MTTTRRSMIVAVACALLARGRSASAQERPIEVKVGRHVDFQLPRQPQIIDIEDHAVATLTILPDGRARIQGVAVGTTRIIGRDFGDLPMIFAVRVVAQ